MSSTDGLIEKFLKGREPGESFIIEVEDMVETNDGVTDMVKSIIGTVSKNGFSVVGIYDPKELVDDFTKCVQVFSNFKDTVTFGKHKGLLFIELVTKHTGYVTWALRKGAIRITEELSNQLAKSVIPKDE